MFGVAVGLVLKHYNIEKTHTDMYLHIPRMTCTRLLNFLGFTISARIWDFLVFIFLRNYTQVMMINLLKYIIHCNNVFFFSVDLAFFLIERYCLRGTFNFFFQDTRDKLCRENDILYLV